MIKEGKGQVPPKPIEVLLDAHEVSALDRIAEERLRFRGYANSNSQWKRGLCGDAKRAIIIGESGQYAMSRFLGIPNDTSLKIAGDGEIDLSFKGLTIQVKTRGTSQKMNLIRRVTDKKLIVPMPAQILAFCQYRNASSVWLLGWVRYRLTITNAVFRKSKYGHWNLVLGDDLLSPIVSLREEVDLLR